MKIVHFLSGLEVGGKERQVLQLAGRARRAGRAAELLLFDTPFRSTEVDFDPGEVATHFLARGPGFDWRFAREVARWLRERPCDVLHAHNDTAVFYAGLVARILGSRAPAMLGTFHTKPGHDTWKARLATRLAARSLGAVTAVSEELAGVCRRDGWTHRCDVVWNGVDLDAFTPDGPDAGWRERLSVDAEALLVGHVGRFDPIKRQEDLLAATRAAAREVPVVTVFVGQGPGRPAFLETLREGDPVRTIGRVENVASFLRALDLFVLCSAHEAAPRVLLEALACGRPVVATRVGGIPYIVEVPGEAPAGLLVEPRRPEALAEALVALARSPDRRAELARRARKRAGAFSADREWERYAELYERVLG